MTKPLFSIGKDPVTPGTLAVVLGILLFTWILVALIRRSVRRAASRAGVDRRQAASFGRLLSYVIAVTGVLMALQTVGVELGALFAAGAVFAVGLGFAMQNIVQNFVSGVILLVERSIKPGDVLEVEKQLVQVEEIGIRTTLVRTLDEEALIVPNATLVQSTVKNFTAVDMRFRLRVRVGVAYESDMAKVREVLEVVGHGLGWRDPSRDPVVLLQDFGASSVDWELSVWTEDPWKQRAHRSLAREAIWNAFAEAELTIAFPQLDVHFDAPVTEALSRLPRAA
jgi:small-conductance mechanosensitive channel